MGVTSQFTAQLFCLFALETWGFLFKSPFWGAILKAAVETRKSKIGKRN